MLSDIEIAQNAQVQPIVNIARKLGIDEDDLEYYGRYKAKLSERLIKERSAGKDGRLILVTAINPTPAGEGKTTTSVGLGDALSLIGKKTMIALREPSLGPVFGVKGGAAGGGYAQVVPMEDINLHFTGDMHAITAANNLLCAMLDNHIQQGNSLGIDVKKILIKRCLDMNDRELRNIVAGLGGRVNGVPREDGFIITVGLNDAASKSRNSSPHYEDLDESSTERIRETTTTTESTTSADDGESYDGGDDYEEDYYYEEFIA